MPVCCTDDHEGSQDGIIIVYFIFTVLLLNNQLWVLYISSHHPCRPDNDGANGRTPHEGTHQYVLRLYGDTYIVRLQFGDNSYNIVAFCYLFGLFIV